MQWPPVLLPPIDSGTGPKLKGGKHRKATFTPFSESMWGSQTRSFADTAARISDDHWNSITAGAITDEIQQIIDALSDSDGNQDAPFASGQANHDSCANLRM